MLYIHYETKALRQVLRGAVKIAKMLGSRYVTPEHVLASLCAEPGVHDYSGETPDNWPEAEAVLRALLSYFLTPGYDFKVADRTMAYTPEPSAMLEELANLLYRQMIVGEETCIDVPQLVECLFGTMPSMASELITEYVADINALIDTLAERYETHRRGPVGPDEGDVELGDLEEALADVLADFDDAELPVVDWEDDSDADGEFSRNANADAFCMDELSDTLIPRQLGPDADEWEASNANVAFFGFLFDYPDGFDFPYTRYADDEEPADDDPDDALNFDADDDAAEEDDFSDGDLDDAPDAADEALDDEGDADEEDAENQGEDAETAADDGAAAQADGALSPEDFIKSLFGDQKNVVITAHASARPRRKPKADWEELVVRLDPDATDRPALIGREEELERTIQVLCRKDRSNVLHVGEPGVGKTALIHGLAARIAGGTVPTRLKDRPIFSLEAGNLMAGAQFRGDMERRIKEIVDGVASVGGILYLDDVHLFVNAGQGDGSTSAANILLPRIEATGISVVGATTYDDFNRHIARNKAFMRRFEKIDIAEPSQELTRRILSALAPSYEAFHGVSYDADALDFAVSAAAKYINDRRLPDKAIALIDEAGAWVSAQPSRYVESGPKADDKASDGDGKTPVTRDIMARTLAAICHVDALAEDRDDTERLRSLDKQLRARVFGQDEAIGQVSEAVLMGAAGLLAENKPMASLLFVGPTGVGKTEVARVLADELHLPLLRFDMSEYAEKHTVAKLIGAPAGYVGYDDGGLLTDAVRRSPHCVLLFDEIEKAHPDIYNIMLQIMDYAQLTDSKGEKVDFRHAIVLITTNAGAQHARQAGLGFVKASTAGQAMLKAVRQTFKPEFLNRLTAVTVFRDISAEMADKILDKKLAELQSLLTAKRVKLTLTPAARAQLLEEGFSPEYGGREIERVIGARLKPLLTRAILFGSLKNGGSATIDFREADKDFFINSRARKKKA